MVRTLIWSLVRSSEKGTAEPWFGRFSEFSSEFGERNGPNPGSAGSEFGERTFFFLFSFF